MRLHRLNGDSSEGSCFLLLPSLRPACKTIRAWQVKTRCVRLAGLRQVSRRGRVLVACPITGVKAAAIVGGASLLASSQVSSWAWLCQLAARASKAAARRARVRLTSKAAAAATALAAYLSLENSLHMNVVRQYLFGRLWAHMQSPSSQYYAAELRDALQASALFYAQTQCLSCCFNISNQSETKWSRRACQPRRRRTAVTAT